jgi:hypothetical protein
MNIGIVGFSSDQIDHLAAHKLLQQSMQQLVSWHAPKAKPGDIRIISGLTNIGVPKVAYQIADQLGYRTVGISAARALKVHCGMYDVHERIIIGREFGDESLQFVTAIDYLIRIGGGKQSRHELGLFKGKCALLGWSVAEHVIEHDLDLLPSTTTP